MPVLPVDKEHAIIISDGKPYFYSLPVKNIFIHIPGEYPTLKALDRKYKLPRLDKTVTTSRTRKIAYHTEIFEVGTILYSDPLPPEIFHNIECDEKIYIGVISLPLEHNVRNPTGDSIKVLFGTVSAYIDPESNKIYISFAPNTPGRESLYSLLYYTFTREKSFNKTIELALRTLEWSNPTDYNEELEHDYRQMIIKRLKKISPRFKPLDYTPLYYKEGELFIENPEQIPEINSKRLEILKTVFRLL